MEFKVTSSRTTLKRTIIYQKHKKSEKKISCHSSYKLFIKRSGSKRYFTSIRLHTLSEKEKYVSKSF